MSSKKNKRKPRPEELNIRYALSASLRGTAVAFIAALLIIPLTAALALAFSDPGTAAKILAPLALFLIAVCGGFASRKFCPGLSLICGLLTGVFITLITLVLLLITPVPCLYGFSPAAAFAVRLPLIAAPLVGAFLAAYRKPKRKRRK